MSKNGNGYLKFNLSDKKKLEKTYTYSNHRFVYEVFRGPIPSCLEVDHINNVKTNNKIKNLQLLTKKKNIQKSQNKPIISTCINTGKERRFISIKTAAVELNIDAGNIPKVCKKNINF